MCASGEELQRPGVFVEDTFGDVLGPADVVHLVQEVGMRDDAALRPSGGPGGVDDRGQGFAVDGAAASHDRPIGDIASCGNEPVDAARVDHPHVAQVGPGYLRPGDGLRMVPGLHKGEHGL